jgi:hypothetical protein
MVPLRDNEQAGIGHQVSYREPGKLRTGGSDPFPYHLGVAVSRSTRDSQIQPQAFVTGSLSSAQRIMTGWYREPSPLLLYKEQQGLFAPLMHVRKRIRIQND